MRTNIVIDDKLMKDALPCAPRAPGGLRRNLTSALRKHSSLRQRQDALLEYPEFGVDDVLVGIVTGVFE